MQRTKVKRQKQQNRLEVAPLPPIAAFEQARAVADAQSRLDIITPEQRAKGCYDGGGRIVNRGGTPVARWVAAGKLSETQALAIAVCYRLWDMTSVEPRTTASYDELIPGGDDLDHHAVTTLEAQKDLYEIIDYFPAPLNAWWKVFENVCRFNEPAGVAGSRLANCVGKSADTAERRAYVIVCLVADKIAERRRLIPNARIKVA